MTTTVTITGLREMRVALMQKVPQHFQGQVLQQALLAGAKPIIADAQFRVPMRSGVLYRAIYSYPDKQGSTRTFQSRFIGVRHGKKEQKSNRDAYYWRWIEFGRGQIVAKNARVLGNTKSGFFGKVVSAVPPHPFLRPAFEAAKDQAVNEVKKRLAAELEVAANKAHWGGPSNFSQGQRAVATLTNIIEDVTTGVGDTLENVGAAIGELL